METEDFNIFAKQIVINTNGVICSSARAALQSPVFSFFVKKFLNEQSEQKSPSIHKLFPDGLTDKETITSFINLLRSLVDHPLNKIAKLLPSAQFFLQDNNHLSLIEFVEKLYDYWRSFDRFMVLHSEPGITSCEHRPYRSFNDTIESLNHLIRSAYRDICENITGDHPRIFRQVPAGCNIGLIAVPKKTFLPKMYEEVLKDISFIRQVWIAPPMIIDPPMNKRTGVFEKVNLNPIANLVLDKKEWLCYPAQVGELVIFIYFHQRFIGLGCALSNLFNLATDEQIKSKPDAVYLYGVTSKSIAGFGESNTVFYDDETNNILAAAVPGEDKFGYFGYLKKMTLTLHNIAMMKKGRLPFHGSMISLGLKNGKVSNILLIGDTATGKSESLEAFRIIGNDSISEMRIVADDMGSLDISLDGVVRAYGTEIGAFVRLDDLQLGYAFGQLDRAIIMSPQKKNARLVMPITTMDEVLKGYKVDYMLYANNYENVDVEHPVIERYNTPKEALSVFSGGRAMSKGTTTSSGLIQTYFANIFGPVQYKELHDSLASKFFETAFKSEVFVGQLRTRLAVEGCEFKGPEKAAGALLELLLNKGE